jgi:hypothetical protein
VAGRGENGIGKVTAAHADRSAIRQTKAENFSRVGAKWPQPTSAPLVQPLASDAALGIRRCNCRQGKWRVR